MRIGQADPMVLGRRLAKHCEAALASGDEESALADLSGRFRAELTPEVEYIVLMSPEGRTHVHTNKLREGRVYADAANLAAAALRTAETRRYDRNTGEVIREAVVPVRRAGVHYAVLRVGQIVPRGSLRGRVAASLGLAALAPVAAVAVVGDPVAVAAAAGAGAVCAGGLAVWNRRRIDAPVRLFTDAARAVTGGDLTATVAGAGRDELGQMGFEFNKVVLGLQKVIEASGAGAASVADLAERMATGTGEDATAMAQIAASCEQTHLEVGDQAARADEAVSAARRVTDGLTETSRRAAAARGALEDVRGAAVTGGTGLHEASAVMGSARRAVEDGAERVEALRLRSEEIEGIVDSISRIAAQTDLLALNAAIEGARAGDHGRGFMVVAEEVRGLAEQADEAARSIRGLVGDVQAETERAADALETGRAEVAAAADRVGEVRRSVGDVAERLDRVGEAMGDMERAAHGLGDDVTLVGEVSARSAEMARATVAATESIAAATQQSAATSDESARSARELLDVSSRLRELVGRFRVA